MSKPKPTKWTPEQVREAKKLADTEGTFEWADVVIRCTCCRQQVELTTAELNDDGTTPARYICAECEF